MESLLHTLVLGLQGWHPLALLQAVGPETLFRSEDWAGGHDLPAGCSPQSLATRPWLFLIAWSGSVLLAATLAVLLVVVVVF